MVDTAQRVETSGVADVGQALADDLDQKQPVVAHVPIAPGGDMHHVALLQGPGLLAPLLVPAPAAGAEQDLSAPGFRVVDVPEVAAARLKGHVEDLHVLLVGF